MGVYSLGFLLMHLGACCFRALYVDLRSLPVHRLLGQPKQQQKLPGFFIATAARAAPPKRGKPGVPERHHHANSSVLRMSVSTADIE